MSLIEKIAIVPENFGQLRHYVSHSPNDTAAGPGCVFSLGARVEEQGAYTFRHDDASATGPHYAEHVFHSLIL
ncbi:MAG TPA: hypothetical protein VK530_16715 [Candidatus Acidoferrum sp.]|nr:hypothetical protein [Candidatus Acidoferrum sp.]